MNVFEKAKKIEKLLETDKPMICKGDIYLKTAYVHEVLHDIKLRAHMGGMTKADALLISILADFYIPV